MGVSSSCDHDLLFHEIKTTIRELIKNYEFWSNEKICDNLEAMYHDKLIRFSDDTLFNITVSIGYKVDKDYSKDRLCKMIIAHYKRRILLLQKINSAVEECREMIEKATHGPVCKKVDRYIDDFFTCRQIPQALWIPSEEYKEIIRVYKKHNVDQERKRWVESLTKHYYRSLKTILKIINKIKNDIDTAMSNNDFNDLEGFTCKKIEEMKLLCEIYYLLAINYKP